MPGNIGDGCFAPDLFGAMGDMGDLGDLDLGLDDLNFDDIDLSGLEDLDTTSGGRRLQDDLNLDDMMADLDAAMGDVMAELGDAMGEALGALSMSVMLRCGDKVVMSAWQSADCTGEPIPD